MQVSNQTTPVRPTCTAPKPVSGLRSRRAFTFIELLVVLTIMVLMTAIAAPSFAKLLQTSKVSQATKIAIQACELASRLARDSNNVVLLYFGDDVSNYKLATPPVWGDGTAVPKKGRIEIWSTEVAGNMTPFVPGYGTLSAPSGWYAPFQLPISMLSQMPETIPDGVRVIVGDWEPTTNGVPGNTFHFPYYDKGGSPGDIPAVAELKRHYISYGPDGTSPAGQNINGSLYSCSCLLIFDENSGDYAIVKCGGADWQGSTAFIRATVQNTVKYPLKFISNQPVTDYRQLGTLIDNAPASIPPTSFTP